MPVKRDQPQTMDEVKADLRRAREALKARLLAARDSLRGFKEGAVIVPSRSTGKPEKKGW